MIVSTPYIECHIKQSFLKDSPVYTVDETIFAILIAIRFIRGRAPLYIVYIPSIGAIYDKIDQCAIFKEAQMPDVKITQSDVAWWDCISDYWQLVELKFFKNFDITATMRNGIIRKGKYLFTADPQNKHDGINFGQAEIWHEHKTKTFFFDDETGVLTCAPNNKICVTDSSLSPEVLDSPNWLRAYHETSERMSHESDVFLGDTISWNYK